jgi:hypothetical protein
MNKEDTAIPHRYLLAFYKPHLYQYLKRGTQGQSEMLVPLLRTEYYARLPVLVGDRLVDHRPTAIGGGYNGTCRVLQAARARGRQYHRCRISLRIAAATHVQ